MVWTVGILHTLQCRKWSPWRIVYEWNFFKLCMMIKGRQITTMRFEHRRSHKFTMKMQNDLH